MGIQQDVATYIARLAATLPRGFSVCELGDQGLCGEGKHNPAQPWYQQLGCGRYVSIDANGRGIVTADLNRPVSLGVFDLVTDFGTGEHIFDQAQVWRTLHDLTKPGGCIAFDRPGQGYQKHCFYLVNECLLYDLAAANAYDVLWIARATTPRGELIRGCFRKPEQAGAFTVPQQGRYRGDLRIPA